MPHGTWTHSFLLNTCIPSAKGLRSPVFADPLHENILAHRLHIGGSWLIFLKYCQQFSYVLFIPASCFVTINEGWANGLSRLSSRSRTGRQSIVEIVELTKKKHHSDFVATNSWLSRWKTRHNIKFKYIHGEKRSANNINAEEWQSKNVPIYISTYSPDNIYNSDETGLYYRALDSSLCHKHLKKVGLQKSIGPYYCLVLCKYDRKWKTKATNHRKKK